MLHRSRALAAALTTGLVTSGLTAGLVVAAVASAGPAAASVDVEHGTVAQAPSTQTVSFADGVVYGIAQVGTKVFVGGSFTKVGPGIRGAAGVVDVANSTFGSTLPRRERRDLRRRPRRQRRLLPRRRLLQRRRAASRRPRPGRLRRQRDLVGAHHEQPGPCARGRPRRRLRRRRLQHDQRLGGELPRQGRLDRRAGLERQRRRRLRPLARTERGLLHPVRRRRVHPARRRQHAQAVRCGDRGDRPGGARLRARHGQPARLRASPSRAATSGSAATSPWSTAPRASTWRGQRQHRCAGRDGGGRQRPRQPAAARRHRREPLRRGHVLHRGGHDPAQRRVDRHLVVRGRGADLPDADGHGLRHRAGRHDRSGRDRQLHAEPDQDRPDRPGQGRPRARPR